MFQIQIGENYYNVSGAEAAWNAFQKACDFVETVGGDLGDVWLVDCELADHGPGAPNYYTTPPRKNQVTNCYKWLQKVTIPKL